MAKPESGVADPKGVLSGITSFDLHAVEELHGTWLQAVQGKGQYGPWRCSHGSRFSRCPQPRLLQFHSHPYRKNKCNDKTVQKALCFWGLRPALTFGLRSMSQSSFRSGWRLSVKKKWEPPTKPVCRSTRLPHVHTGTHWDAKLNNLTPLEQVCKGLRLVDAFVIAVLSSVMK